MLRFCRKDFINTDAIQIIMADISISFNSNMWEYAREYFKHNVCDDIDVLRLLPVIDEKREIICYAYQDNEANRELRMLKELERMEDALQFDHIFCDIHSVIIYGCNELAYYFIKYLEGRQVTVLVRGEYWSFLGYTEETEINESKENALIVYAEYIFQNIKLEQMLIRSVSPAFECIDKIFEENVKRGIIRDVENGIEDFWKRLKGSRIAIIGTSLKRQDVYDLIYEHGIDIEVFVEEYRNKCEKHGSRTLLGKKIVDFEQVLASGENIVFIDCVGKNSALGNQYVELLDYYGYERNKKLFFINDYTDVPFSNLVHVLDGKKVLITGDECLCKLLLEYLYMVEKGNIEVQYISLGQKVIGGEDDIRCVVVPHSRNRRKNVDVENARQRKSLSEMGFDNYTEYFMRHQAFVLIDRYLNSNREKYTVSELTPKGILLGRIPSFSGNVLFREIMDRHPKILVIPYSDLSNNLFYYCIRLAEYNSTEILSEFWKLYDAEASTKEVYFTNVETFEESFKRMLGYKMFFTSQELFIMFHVAYKEMLSGKQFIDVSNLVIYWEPHYIGRDEFPFLALWLEDIKVNGHTVRLRRNNIMRTGSYCERATDQGDGKIHMFDAMFLEDADNDTVGQRCFCQYWSEHKLRFEDIKVHPKENLLKICEWLDIPWLDDMMKTTSFEEIQVYWENIISSLQPVFKKSEEYLSEFDRFRISMACSPYQKKYGYTYDNCMRFSRNELQEMYLKPFLFEEQGIFEYSAQDYIKVREQMRWNLWNIRKHIVLNDIYPEFERFELKQERRRL